jgi:hypothetical protein
MLSATISGNNMRNDTWPDWEQVLAEYKNLDPRWCDWQTVKATCTDCAVLIFDRIVGLEV